MPSSDSSDRRAAQAAPVPEWPDDDSQDAQVPNPDDHMGVPTPTEPDPGHPPPAGPTLAPAPSPPTTEPTNTDLLNAISALGNNLGTRLGNVEDAINTHSDRIGELQRRTERQETATAALLRRVEAIENRPSHMPTSTAPSSRESTGTANVGRLRDPYQVDWSIARVNTPSLVTSRAVWNTMQHYIAKAGVPASSVSMAGPVSDEKLAKRFVLRCDDSGGNAAKHRKDIVHFLRRPDRTYEQPSIQAPSGTRIQMYIALDESLASIARKTATKCIYKLILVSGKGDGVTAAPRDGVIARDWSVRIECRYDTANRRPAASWHDEALRDAGLDPDALRASYAADATDPDRSTARW